MRQIILLLSILSAVSLIACGSDAGSQRPDSGWTIDEDSGVSEDPDGLPNDYVDHPIGEKRFHPASRNRCDVPESSSDGAGVSGQFDQPVVGTALLLGLKPVEFDPIRIERFNYNFFVRFPRKSSRWHRFETRRTSPGKAYRLTWGEMREPLMYVRSGSLAISFTLATPSCRLPTQQEVDHFVAEFSEIEIIFHNPETDETYRFAPTEPNAVLVNGPSAILNDRSPAALTWDLPLNRPQQPIPAFLRPRR